MYRALDIHQVLTKNWLKHSLLVLEVDAIALLSFVLIFQASPGVHSYSQDLIVSDVEIDPVLLSFIATI